MPRWIRYTIFVLIFSLHCSEGKHKMHLALWGCINFYIRNKSSKNLHPTSVFGSEFGYKLALAMRIVIAMILKSESISKSSVQKEKRKRMWQFCEGGIKYICHPQGKFVTKMKCNILWIFCLKKKLLVGNIMNLISAHWQSSYAVYLSFFCSKLGKIKWLGNFVKRSPHKRVAASGVVSFRQSFGFLRESRDTSDLLLTSFSRVSGLFHRWQNMRGSN